MNPPECFDYHDETPAPDEDEPSRPPAEPEPRPGHHGPFCIVDHPGVLYCPPF